MKTFKIHIKESIFDDVEDIVNNDNVLIEQFLKDNYHISGTYVVKNNTVDVRGDVNVINEKIESLTNGIFRFGTVSGNFDCADCHKLTSFEGGPEKVSKDFDCEGCNNLKSLEGAPKEVGGHFNCTYCISLTSLKGAPKEVGGCFDCSNCSILKISDQDRKKYKIVT